MAFTIIFRHIPGNEVEFHGGMLEGGIGQVVYGYQFVLHQRYDS